MIVWVIITIIILVVLFLLIDNIRMMRIQSEIRKAYIEEGLTYYQANKVAWYLIDMFIYMRKNKDPKLAKIAMNSTMTIFKQRLHKNDAYEGKLSAKIQVDAIRDACLVFNRPVIEAANLMYSSIVSSYKEYLKKKSI